MKTYKTIISREIVTSGDFKELRDTVKEIKDILGTPPYILDGENKYSAISIQELHEIIVDVGTKGIYVQRYKGLGEMNPGQLWETTMDPEKRILVKISIEDAVEAEGVFSMLMGEKVEPRRKFIEENAWDVKNLDI